MKAKKVHIITEDEEIAFRVFWSNLGMQVALMESQGYSHAQRRRYIAGVYRSLSEGRLDEGFMDSVASAAKWMSNNGLFQGFQKMFGKAIAGPLAKLIGIPENSYIYKVFVNVVENLDAATVESVIAGNGCKPLVAKFAGALQESIVETVLQNMNVAQSGITAALAEALQTAFVEGGPFVETISQKVCNFDFESVLPGMGDAKEIANKAAAEQGTAVPATAAAQLDAAPAGAAPAAT